MLNTKAPDLVLIKPGESITDVSPEMFERVYGVIEQLSMIVESSPWSRISERAWEQVVPGAEESMPGVLTHRVVLLPGVFRRVICRIALMLICVDRQGVES
jgi:hypothetical protein